MFNLILWHLTLLIHIGNISNQRLDVTDYRVKCLDGKPTNIYEHIYYDMKNANKSVTNVRISHRFVGIVRFEKILNHQSQYYMIHEKSEIIFNVVFIKQINSSNEYIIVSENTGIFCYFQIIL